VGGGAVGLFNRSWSLREVAVDLAQIGFPNGATLRDVWSQQDLGRHAGTFSHIVSKHGVMLLIVSP
jgi:alpha-galactosidase